MGNIHLGRSKSGAEFSLADEETLVMFAAQAALVRFTRFLRKHSISSAATLRKFRSANLEASVDL